MKMTMDNNNMHNTRKNGRKNETTQMAVRD
jgi:hypothetical protein